MLIWAPGQLEAVDLALDRGRGGTPTVLVVEGDDGTGKTSLLDEVVERAHGFAVSYAEGSERGQNPPFDILGQWGVDPGAAGSPGAAGVSTAAQGLAALLDARAHDGPVLLRLDDLQWADPESVDALTWLLRRSDGDRLLVAVATRPLDHDAHADWQRWVSARNRSVQVALSGLDLDAATGLAHQLQPHLDPDVVRRLWEHTAGNPLHLTTLLTQHTAEDLVQMSVLPVPTGYAAALRGRLDSLPGPSVRLARSVAVLGTGWVPLRDAAAVGGVEKPGEAAQPLLDAEILHTTTLRVGTSIAFPNGMMRAAVYELTPLPERRDLHAAAAVHASQPHDVFQHRIGATDGYDDGLAVELEDWATVLHGEGSHRLAAGYLRAASGLSSASSARERRWLDSLFESALGQELTVVRAERAAVEQAEDHARRDLVLGTLSMLENKNHDAVHWLSKRSGETGPEPASPLVLYRIEATLAWSLLKAGDPTEQIAASLSRMAEIDAYDPALQGWVDFTRGNVGLRRLPPQLLLDQVGDLPANPAAVEWTDNARLRWRGTLHAVFGHVAPATADLVQTLERIDEGSQESGRPSFHALLAYAQWLGGEWSLARLNLRLAVEMSRARQAAQPVVAAIAPYVEVTGDEQGWSTLRDAAESTLAENPWVEPYDLFAAARVARLHAVGTTEQRADAFGVLEATAREVVAGSLNKTGLWSAHAALAALWAGQGEMVEQLVETMTATAPAGTPWQPSMERWLLGLLAESHGRGADALEHLAAAAADRTNDLPLYRAHMLADHARLAFLLADRAGAEASRHEAAGIYARLGATAYLDGATGHATRSQVPAPRNRTNPALVQPLTEREQDVLTLVSSGMSYAQIARDLFVTQSTVGYHLSNIYRKVGVTSRHQLTELVRGDPAGFGLAVG